VLDQTLAGVRAQRLDQSASIELIVCDSSSHDGSVSIARSYGADIIEIPVEQFSHGETRIC
jgi:rhamnosyltransferase